MSKVLTKNNHIYVSMPPHLSILLPFSSVTIFKVMLSVLIQLKHYYLVIVNERVIYENLFYNI